MTAAPPFIRSDVPICRRDQVLFVHEDHRVKLGELMFLRQKLINLIAVVQDVAGVEIIRIQDGGGRHRKTLAWGRHRDSHGETRSMVTPAPLNYR